MSAAVNPWSFEPTRKRIQRRLFPGEPFFEVPARLYDGGYAARMSPTQITRYLTLLRLSNYEYGETIVLMSARELSLLDGIAPRTSRHVHAKLRELGLLQKDETNKRAHVLVHPALWRDLEGPKPRLKRLESGTLQCITEGDKITPTREAIWPKVSD